MDYDSFKLTLEDHIKSGRTSEVKKLLYTINFKKVPRSQVYPIAVLARRAGYANEALKILNPVVRPKVVLDTPPNDQELALYASILLKIGAFYEADKILNSLNDQNNPQVILYKVFSYIYQWNYKATIPLLKRYLSFETLTSQQQLAGMLNLAQAHEIAGNFEKLNLLLVKIKSLAESIKHQLFLANAYELDAQSHIAQKKYEKAEVLLEVAQSTIPKDDNIYEFFIRKWHSIIQLSKGEHDQKSLDHLNLIKTEALKRQHWETYRDCVLHLSIFKNDVNQFYSVYFGTPYKPYRTKILKENPNSLKLPPKIYWDPFTNTTVKDLSKQIYFDTSLGEDSLGNSSFKPGLVNHRLFYGLTLDFFRPQRVGTLFNLINPDEYFDPETSPDRVYSAVKRLNSWFRKNDIPLNVHHSKSTFQLKATDTYFIKINKNITPPSANEVRMLRLKRHYPYQSFSILEAASSLNVSKRTTGELIKWLVSQNKIIKTGNTKGAIYRFLK